ncbi:hypothetical protein BDV25DRAFT_131539 [Aspergillus avenaceus]|uniref:Fucose-specific lectin n=1 Tax=Aspergillus avenaceus TaxID=36643 RepID=A0A5N6TP67_ASPAV|nr:hypothetical protein BDV25DRAFT_131539 [Aspergillus avenaceus]
MSSLDSTDLAGISTNDQDIYLFYQRSGNIVEAFTEQESSPPTESVNVASDAQNNGSPLTAYYVKEDQDHDKKSTIHLIYINKDRTLVEKVRVLPGEDWQDAPKPPGEAVDQSRICSDVSQIDRGPDSPPGSQWVYFTSQEGNKLPLTELRRNNKGNFHIERVLPEKSLSLPGTHLACVVTRERVDVYHQDHDKNIKLWRHETQKSSSWEDMGTVVEGRKVMVNTPLAAVNKDGMNHLIYADNQMKIMDMVEGKTIQVASRIYGNAGINAIPYKDRVVLFYKLIDPVGAIGTASYRDGKWKEEGPFIK